MSMAKKNEIIVKDVANDVDDLGGGYVLVGVDSDDNGLAIRPVECQDVSSPETPSVYKMSDKCRNAILLKLWPGLYLVCG